MRWTISSIWRKRGRNLGNLHAQEAGLDYHFAGEFHSRGAKIHALESRVGESADAAVKVLDRGPEQCPANRGKDRRADIAVLPGHRAALYGSRETVSNY